MLEQGDQPMVSYKQTTQISATINQDKASNGNAKTKHNKTCFIFEMTSFIQYKLLVSNGIFCQRPRYIKPGSPSS